MLLTGFSSSGKHHGVMPFYAPLWNLWTDSETSEDAVVEAWPRNWHVGPGDGSNTMGSKTEGEETSVTPPLVLNNQAPGKGCR